MSVTRMLTPHHRLTFTTALALMVGLLTGCAPATPAPTATTPTSSPAPSVAPVAKSVGMVATATVPEVAALDAPNGSEVARFTNPTASDAPLVFLVEEAQGDWLHVQLPMRPNGSTGWVRASDMTLAQLHYSLAISTADRTLMLLKDNEPVKVFPAAIGTGDTPTPLGRFFIVELLEPTNDGYGPYAYGLSAFSDVLNSFGGGPGQIGIHGTDDADSIGQAASHGCIRLNNDDITYLAGILPLGTPVTIT